MDAEKSSNSSFEDLSTLNENELKEAQQSMDNANSSKSVEDTPKEEDLDILGNGQLTKRVLQEGSSSIQPQRGDLCRISCTGKLENGQIVEDYTDVTVQMGDLEVVQGLDMALALMKIGEIAEIKVDARFAYGEIGLKNETDKSKEIPPNAKIIYTVELIESKEEDELDLMPYEIRKTIGNKKRDRGNFWYERDEFTLAIQLYRRALDYLDENSLDRDSDSAKSNDQIKDLLEDRVKAYNNLAAAQMKIAAFDTALTSVEHVLRCQPDNVKALFRKGKILDAIGDTNAAIPILQKAATLDAENKAIQQLLGKLIMKSRRDARNEKDLYQKMLGQAQKMEQKAHRSKSDTNVSSKLKIWGYLMGSILIGVAGVAMYRYKYF